MATALPISGPTSTVNFTLLRLMLLSMLNHQDLEGTKDKKEKGVPGSSVSACSRAQTVRPGSLGRVDVLGSLDAAPRARLSRTTHDLTHLKNWLITSAATAAESMQLEGSTPWQSATPVLLSCTL